MKISRGLFRTGVCIIIIGLSIFLANLTSTLRGSTIFMSFEVPANEICIVVNELHNRQYEIRILVPEEFNGTLCILNYEGIKKITEGEKTPVLEQTLEGPSLVDFTPNRRGAYLFMIESNVSTTMYGSIGIVEKKGISQDMLADSIIITAVGTATAIAANIPKISKNLKKQRYS